MSFCADLPFRKEKTDIEFRSYFPFRCNLLLKHSENMDRNATHQGILLNITKVPD